MVHISAFWKGTAPLTAFVPFFFWERCKGIMIFVFSWRQRFRKFLVCKCLNQNWTFFKDWMPETLGWYNECFWRWNKMTWQSLPGYLQPVRLKLIVSVSACYFCAQYASDRQQTDCGCPYTSHLRLSLGLADLNWISPLCGWQNIVRHSRLFIYWS